MMPDKLTTIIDTLATMREENTMLKTLITTEVSDIHKKIRSKTTARNVIARIFKLKNCLNHFRKRSESTPRP